MVRLTVDVLDNSIVRQKTEVVSWNCGNGKASDRFGWSVFQNFIFV
jgi:hypothetical protein